MSTYAKSRPYILQKGEFRGCLGSVLSFVRFGFWRKWKPVRLGWMGFELL